MNNLDWLYKKIKERTVRTNPNFYQPLPKNESEIIRQDYKNKLNMPIEGDNVTKFYTNSGLHIATGYIRVVIGDYGAYIEFSPEQINHNVIKNKFDGIPNRPVKYIWKESIDCCKVKVYDQKGIVPYADYKIGMYYISPEELVTDDNEFLYI
jgi:hypothetical protein